NADNDWAKDTVKTDTTILQLLQTDITADSLGQPVVVVAGLRANSAPSLRSYQWRGDTIWHEQIVQTPFPGASLSPIVLTNDSIGRPWLLYTREALVNEPQIMHLGVESESWHDLYVDNNLPNGQIQNRADLLISGQRLYVIGAETAPTNSGIGLLTLPDWTTVVDSFVSARPNLLAEQNRLHVYPNPTSEHVTLELEKAVASADIELLNLMGQRVANWQWQTESRDQRSAQLQLPDLPAGVYSMVFRGKATRFALKLVVQ
ncbi:MAG: T9SS type A sorting domain-containing protein, partial [Bacteroidota bacterium]